MRISVASHVGRVRQRNEDHLCVWRHPRRRGVVLLAVADGMGGHRAGEVASALALDVLRRRVRRGLNGQDGGTLLLDGIRQANQRVYNRARRLSRLQGMGTTVTALLVDGHDLFVGHVGDSRAYLLQRGDILQVTVDHSFVGEMLQRGDLTEAEARNHPQRNVLTRALGVEREAAVDTAGLTVEDRAVTVLATDGLTNLVPMDEIAAVIKKDYDDFLFLAHRLVNMAVSRGGQDNVTAIVAEIDAGGAK